jgi:hypothetical protein
VPVSSDSAAGELAAIGTAPGMGVHLMALATVEAWFQRLALAAPGHPNFAHGGCRTGATPQRFCWCCTNSSTTSARVYLHDQVCEDQPGFDHDSTARA